MNDPRREVAERRDAPVLRPGDEIEVIDGADRRDAVVKHFGNLAGELVAVVADDRDATGLRRVHYLDPLGPYAAGWRDALGAAGKCGAYNTDRPPTEYALCVRETGHTGMHDDMRRPWGDRHATAEQNRTDAGDHSRWLRDQRRARGWPA